MIFFYFTHTTRTPPAALHADIWSTLHAASAKEQSTTPDMTALLLLLLLLSFIAP